jgi:hypothetical protein
MIPVEEGKKNTAQKESSKLVQGRSCEKSLLLEDARRKSSTELRQPRSPQPHRLRALAGEASTRTTPRRLCVTADHSFSGTKVRSLCQNGMRWFQFAAKCGSPILWHGGKRQTTEVRTLLRVFASGWGIYYGYTNRSDGVRDRVIYVTRGSSPLIFPNEHQI